jgi:hypothetical protein
MLGSPLWLKTDEAPLLQGINILMGDRIITKHHIQRGVGQTHNWEFDLGKKVLWEEVTIDWENVKIKHMHVVQAEGTVGSETLCPEGA